MNYNNMIFYCETKLGINESSPNSHNSYLFRQIDNYDEVDFIEHIRKHLPDYHDPSTSIFSRDFKLLKVLEEVKNHIPSSNKLFYGFYEDTYVFRYDNCGYDRGKKVDYFKVVCFHNTSDIITMCPSNGCEDLPSINLNYIAFADEQNKGESRIDKFNARYGLK